jgi:hypothetical protein
LYSDLDYPLTSAEAAHYLIGRPGTLGEVRACLAQIGWLADRVIELNGYLTLRGREALIARRLDRAVASDRVWRRARRFVRVLRVLPFVRMIAITGALAMKNSDAHDDIDVLIVTAPDRVWLTRALAIALVYAGKLCGDTLCPNYVISETGAGAGSAHPVCRARVRTDGARVRPDRVRPHVRAEPVDSMSAAQRGAAVLEPTGRSVRTDRARS